MKSTSVRSCGLSPVDLWNSLGSTCGFIDAQLYLPESWTDNPQRCSEAKIPAEHGKHLTKTQIAMEMIRRAKTASIEFGWVGFDALYESTPWLLREVEEMGVEFVAGWIAWHHHVALVMLAMLFLLRERQIHLAEIDLLSCQDIVELLNVFLPRRDLTAEAVIGNIARSHRSRRKAIEAARRSSEAKHRDLSSSIVTK